MYGASPAVMVSVAVPAFRSSHVGLDEAVTEATTLTAFAVISSKNTSVRVQPDPGSVTSTSMRYSPTPRLLMTSGVVYSLAPEPRSMGSFGGSNK